jgi:hypothetical protein
MFPLTANLFYFCPSAPSALTTRSRSSPRSSTRRSSGARVSRLRTSFGARAACTFRRTTATIWRVWSTTGRCVPNGCSSSFSFINVCFVNFLFVRWLCNAQQHPIHDFDSDLSASNCTSVPSTHAPHLTHLIPHANRLPLSRRITFLTKHHNTTHANALFPFCCPHETPGGRRAVHCRHRRFAHPRSRRPRLERNRHSDRKGTHGAAINTEIAKLLQKIIMHFRHTHKSPFLFEY